MLTLLGRQATCTLRGARGSRQLHQHPDKETDAAMTSNDLIELSGPGARWVRRLRVLAGSLALVTAVLAFLAAPVFALETSTTSTTTTSSTESSTTTASSTTTSAAATSSAETGYSQTPEKPTEEGYKQKPAKPEAKKAVAPEKEEVTPKEEVVAPHHEVAPESKEAVPAKAKELPFTGFDFRWLVGIGAALLLAGGLSLKLLARRERRGSGR